MSSMATRSYRAPLMAGALAFFVGFTLTPNAQAGFTWTWDCMGDAAGSQTFDPADYGSADEDGNGNTHYMGGLPQTETWGMEWDSLANPDPYVDAALTVTNFSDQYQTFFLLMTLDSIDVIEPNTLMNGGVAATVTNNQFEGGATVRAVAGGSIFKAFIDLNNPMTDVPVATLWDDPFDLTVIGGLSTLSDDLQFGDPSPDLGPPAYSSISIILQFEVSPGDSASVSGIFNIEPVPGPGGLALLAVVGLIRRRRR